MKFKELLQKVSFDDIAPQLERLMRDIGHIRITTIRNIIQGCQQAYDILIQMQPEETDGQVRFCMDYDGAERYGEDPRVDMYSEDNFETCAWPINLGKEIVLDEGVELSNAEIAARCLFHITFYGFTPEQIEQTLTRIAKRAERAMKNRSKWVSADMDKYLKALEDD